MISDGRKFAVFDIDGTLIRWQLYHAIVNSLAKDGYLGNDASEKLKVSRMQWKQRESPEAFHSYERSLIDLYDASVHTVDPKVFDEHTKQVISEYHQQVYAYTRDLIMSLKEEGYVLLAISGSPHEIITELAPEYGFDDWIGSVFEREGGKFTGNKTVASHDKKTHLESLIRKHGLSLAGSIAVGDSGSDIPMLAMVEQPIAFNPDQVLFNAAKEHGWKVVVERKNVIYELEAGHGTYVLA